MKVKLTGKLPSEHACRSYGIHCAKSFQAAVNMVFADRLRYPHIIPCGVNTWTVHIAVAHNRYLKLTVRASRCEATTNA
jgi:hypothetical protein